jgi:hypothetical protein
MKKESERESQVKKESERESQVKKEENPGGDSPAHI